MRRILSFGLRGFVLLVMTASASAQATATATRKITPSVFGGVTGVYTGLDSGRNLSVTAGVDVAFRPASRFHPAIEYRGLFAVDKGGIDSVKNNLGGVKVFARYGRFSPYADLLAGRGETTYANGGFQVPNKVIFYTQSASNVYSVGGGTDVFVGDHLAVKLDLQMQRYSSPVANSGHVYSETGTLGVVYVFHFGRKIY